VRHGVVVIEPDFLDLSLPQDDWSIYTNNRRYPVGIDRLNAKSECGLAAVRVATDNVAIVRGLGLAKNDLENLGYAVQIHEREISYVIIGFSRPVACRLARVFMSRMFERRYYIPQ
jgi:hypothetical protein